MPQLHFFLALALLVLSVLWGPQGCGAISATQPAPVSVRENPASYIPVYSPRYSSTSSSGGGWSSGK